jgi:hypothetical protein
MTAKAEAERSVLCKHLDGKGLFTAMLRLYDLIDRELHESLLPEQQSCEGFCEQKRRKQNPSEEQLKK